MVITSDKTLSTVSNNMNNSVFVFQHYSKECLQHVQRHLLKNDVPVSLFEVSLFLY